MTDPRHTDPLHTNERVVTASDSANTTERVVHGVDSATGTERVVTAATQPTSQQSQHHLAAADYQASQMHDQDKLYLYEERARVDVSVESQGQVIFRKKIVEQQESIPVTIRREILEIVTAPGNGTVHVDGITLDGKQLEAGRTYEVVLTEERAHITKQVFPVQEVNVRKQQISEQHSETVTLRREVLEINGPAELIHEQKI